MRYVSQIELNVRLSPPSVERICGGNPQENCPACGKRDPPGYWCGVCEQVVTDKRCPLCGLKARKMRLEGGEKGKE